MINNRIYFVYTLEKAKNRTKEKTEMKINYPKLRRWSDFDEYKETTNDQFFIGMLIAMLGFLILLSVTLFSCSMAQASEMTIDLDAIAMIESSGCKNKVGDNGAALGCHQIQKPALADHNNFYPNEKYSHQDMLVDKNSYHVANSYINKIIPRYLKAWGIPDTKENRIIAYNRGPGRFKTWYKSGADYSKLPEVTIKYIKKYKELSKI